MTDTRADRLDARLAEAGLDALVVTDLVNVHYLTGFTGSNGLVITGPGLRRFLTDFRYVDRARTEVHGFELERAANDLLAPLGEGWPAGGLRLGFEDHKLTVRQHGKLADRLPDGVELVAAGGLVEAVRAVKEPGEVEAIREAARLADEALQELLEGGLAGRTERALADALEAGMRRRGAEPCFSTIVAAGANGALPHAAPQDTEVPRDTLVTIDWGVRLDGYCSDCTRTYATGEPGETLRDVYALVERAQLAGLEALAPGPEGHEVDAVARAVIEEGGHGEHFGHGLGHGVGLEVHEAPRLGSSGTDVVEAGNVVTVEPGVYLPGTGGVRIEDLVVVTRGGHEILSGLPKELTVVG